MEAARAPSGKESAERALLKEKIVHDKTKGRFSASKFR
jgi:hypothetical protein